MQLKTPFSKKSTRRVDSRSPNITVRRLKQPRRISINRIESDHDSSSGSISNNLNSKGLLQFLQTKFKSSGSQLCGSCKNVEAIVYCLQCKKNFCFGCLRDHKQRKETINHQCKDIIKSKPHSKEAISRESTNESTSSLVQSFRKRKNQESIEQSQESLPKSQNSETHNLSIENQKPNLFKIIVVGDPCTGKSALIKRLVDDSFQNSIRPTIGVDISLKIIDSKDGSNVQCQIWDLTGSHSFGQFRKVYYKQAHAAIIVFDLTSKETFDNVSRWRKEIDSSDLSIPCLLFANKVDSPIHKVTQQEIDECCKLNKIKNCFRTSAKSNIGIEDGIHDLIDFLISNQQNPVDIIPSPPNNPTTRSLHNILLTKQVQEKPQQKQSQKQFWFKSHLNRLLFWRT